MQCLFSGVCNFESLGSIACQCLLMQLQLFGLLDGRSFADLQFLQVLLLHVDAAKRGAQGITGNVLLHLLL